MNNEILVAALDYVSRGWRVIPVHSPIGGGCSCKNPQCASIAKHPRTRHGVKDGTIDPKIIKCWHNTWPRMNLGIVTGNESDLIVLDIDPQHGGDDSFDYLIDQYGKLPETIEVLTGGGGRHLFFRHPGNGIIVKNAVSIDSYPGLDIRADGGYVVAPPSFHKSGKQYMWEASSSPDLQEIAELPDWLLQLLTVQKKNTNSIVINTNNDKIPEGYRNTALASIAGAFRQRGLNFEEILPSIIAINDKRCDPPLEEAEVQKIIKSICRYDNGKKLPEFSVAMPMPVLHADSTDLLDINKAAWKAISDANFPERLFLYNGHPVRLVSDKNTFSIETLDKYKLQLECAAHAKWIVKKQGQSKPARPPLPLAQSMLAMENIPLPQLFKIVYAPIFTKKGKLISQPGYDKDSCIYYFPGDLTIKSISPNPTQTDIENSKKLITQMFQDFPFVSEADYAHAWAMLFVIPCREMMNHIPASLIESPDAGTGKTLLCECCLIPYTNGDWERFTPAKNEEEERKRYTAALEHGKNAWILDNYNDVSGSQIAGILTTSKWSDRRLGKTEIITSPVHQQIVITGINVVLSKEAARRVIPSRLDAKIEYPSLRTGFTIENLTTWAYQRRAELIQSILILAQAWIAAGMPKPNIKTIGSYEEYCNVIGGILKYTGIPGFLANIIEVFEKSDLEGQSTRDLITTWYIKHNSEKIQVNKIHEIAKDIELLPITGKDESSRRRSLSRFIMKLRDRIFTIEINGKPKVLQIINAGLTKNTNLWMLKDPQSKKIEKELFNEGDFDEKIANIMV